MHRIQDTRHFTLVGHNLGRGSLLVGKILVSRAGQARMWWNGRKPNGFQICDSGEKIKAVFLHRQFFFKVWVNELHFDSKTNEWNVNGLCVPTGYTQVLNIHACICLHERREGGNIDYLFCLLTSMYSVYRYTCMISFLPHGIYACWGEWVHEVIKSQERLLLHHNCTYARSISISTRFSSAAILGVRINSW